MRKLLFSLCLTLFAATMSAVPARKGNYRTLRLTDGTEVRAQLCGDEHMRFYRADNGTCYVAAGNNTYTVADLDALRAKAQKRRAPLAKKMGQRLNAKMEARRSSSSKALSNPGLSDGFYGKKKGLIILVQFSDLKFKAGHDNEFYTKLANQENYTEGNFRGSVHDYFLAQSNGQFDLTFDVVGPVTLSKGYAYYGENTINSNNDEEDKYAGKMVAEACQAIKDKVNWSDYDWDRDGEVDQVFCLYAGYGEADDMGANYIWPHMFYLQAGDYGQTLNMNGTIVDTYACSNELTPSNTDDGIGTICHEFSHCLGYPDLYDTNYNGGYAMGVEWDLMDGGNRNGNSYCPAGYSGFEKWIAGWITPIELSEDAKIENWKPCTLNGETYIIYNDGNRDEFYIIDNRQKTGWDAALPGKGLLVTHVDYNKRVWEYNTLNNTRSHQRWSIIAADNSYSSYTLANDAYPYKTNNSLSKSSTPRNSVFNSNVNGTKLMGKALTDITQNADGTMSFTFKIEKTTTDPIVKPEGALFYESFNLCQGNGGNDGIWSGVSGSSTITPDNDGWTDANGKIFPGSGCLRAGTSDKRADIQSPAFTVNGKAQLTFKAGAWKNESGTLSVYFNNALIGTKTIADQEWTDVTIDFTGTDTGKLRFKGLKRMFLDEVLVKPAESTGISNVTDAAAQQTDMRIFTTDGRYVGTDKEALPKGIYIVGGKKFAK